MIQVAPLLERIRPMTRRSTQSGVSLIEILITMVILMFGLLGVAGLLVSGVSNSAASESMSKANQLLADMADRIRANRDAALSATSEYITAYGESPPTNVTSIALQDKRDWLTAISAQLPSGSGRVTSYVAGGGRKLELQIRWAKCYGTLSEADMTACRDNPDVQYQTVTMEVIL